MQSPTGGPRGAYTTAQIEGLLTGFGLLVDFGAELLNDDLTVAEDISADVVAASVAWQGLTTIHGSCRFQISRELEWGTALVRLFEDFYLDGVAVRFYRGVFCPITPERPKGETPVTYDVNGLDRLHLLDRRVGDTYEVASGTGYLAAARQAITDAGLSGVLLDGSAEASVLPSTRVWPLLGEPGSAPATWLRIVNDLLSAVNYRGVWADENGRYRSEPYVEPVDRAVEWVFDATDPRNTVGEDQTVTEDLWNAPNRWIFVQSNRPDADPPTVGDGIYVVDNVSTGVSSQDGRGGLIFPSETISYEAADHDALVALGDRRVAQDLRRVTTIKATTAPFPLAQHFDVYTWADDDESLKVQAVSWESELGGGDVDFTFEVIS